MRSARCLSRAAIRSDASVTTTSTIEMTLDRAGNVMGGIGAVSDNGGDKKRRVRHHHGQHRGDAREGGRRHDRRVDAIGAMCVSPAVIRCDVDTAIMATIEELLDMEGGDPTGASARSARCVNARR